MLDPWEGRRMDDSISCYTSLRLLVSYIIHICSESKCNERGKGGNVRRLDRGVSRSESINSTAALGVTFHYKRSPCPQRN